MARRPEGWKLKWRSPDGPWQVVFTHNGKREYLPTGTKDRAEAQKRAPKLYAEFISGRRSSAVVHTTTSLELLFGQWLVDMTATLDEDTVRLYETYCRAHYLDFFQELSRFTTESIRDYTRARLRCVQADTVRREHTGLKKFLMWCAEKGLLTELPVIEKIGKKVTGTPDPKGRRKRVKVHLEAHEAEAVLKALPEKSRMGGRPKAFFTVLWETGLRPDTVHGFRAPDDYHVGRATLRIRPENDKVRYGREIPITARARETLDSVCPEVGLLLPHHSYRKIIKKAARTAGLPPEKADNISKYDFRHGRITDLVETDPNLPGVAFLAGHLQISTTNKYVKQSQKAARAVLDKSAAAFWRLSGALSGAAQNSLPNLSEAQRAQLAEMVSEFLVGTGGIEPPTPTVSRKRNIAK